MMLDLSIVIVSWNTKALLRDCLASLRAANLTLSTEIFVVDNASSDGSPELVQTEFPEVCFIQSGANLGFARANNLALKQARGRYFLLLNSDTIVLEGAFEAVVAALDAHPDAAVAGPLLLNLDNSVQLSWARFPGWKSELSGSLDRSQSPYPLTDFDNWETRQAMPPFVCDWIGGAVFFVRASAAKASGLLDEQFFMYSEETEWCHRIKTKTNGTTLLVPSVAVVHLGGGSSQAVPKQTRTRMWRSSLRFYQLTQGLLGSLLPSLIATARFALSPLRRAR
jgi:GT2 family glycosyltransferase